MRPIKFPQANFTLTRPPTMTDEECISLDVYADPNRDQMLSCWQPTWSERLALLFGRPLWLWVFGGRHPPVAIEVHNPFAGDEKHG